MNRAYIVAAIIAAICVGAYFFGRTNQHNADQVKQSEVVEKGIEAHDRAAVAGQTAERQSESRKSKTEAVFNDITQREIVHAKQNAAVQCSLDPDGLRLWRAANAGADADAAGDGYAAMPGAAAASQRSDQRSAVESHRGSEGVSPVPGSAPGVDQLAGENR